MVGLVFAPLADFSYLRKHQPNMQNVKQKELTDLSLEELWQLFPIILTPHQDCWSDWYEEEAGMLQREIPGIRRISHIGSTAIQGIWAKPTVDMLVEVDKEKPLADFKDKIEKRGYIYMAERGNRLDFNKGYTLQGFAERVFHLHLRYVGDNDELYFRDYIQKDATAAKEYERLKLDLWKRYEHDRDAYTLHKSDFIKHYIEMGKQLFPDKYKET